MQFKRTIPKVFIAAIISGIITLISNIIIGLIFGASIAHAVFIFLISTISFAICLVYILQVYHASGEGEVWEDYPEVYPGILKDIIKLIKKEPPTFIIISAFSAAVLILHVISLYLIKIDILKHIISVFKPIASVSYSYSGNLLLRSLEYLIGAFSNCVAYLIAYALFRWKWRRFM